MVRLSCVYLIFSLFLVIINGQFSIPPLSGGISGLVSSGSTLKNALGNVAVRNPVSAHTGSNPFSALGRNLLSDIGNTSQNLLRSMVIRNGTYGFSDALQSAMNDTRCLHATLFQFKLTLYQMKQNYFNSTYNFSETKSMGNDVVTIRPCLAVNQTVLPQIPPRRCKVLFLGQQMLLVVLCLELQILSQI